MSDFVISLEDYIGKEEKALVGRENGKELIAKLASKRAISLPSLEEVNELITIEIPNRVITMNRSYFLGAFSERVQALGKAEFERRYVFDASDYIKDKIKSHIDYALKGSTQSEILNG